MKAHETVMRWVTDELAAGRLAVGDRLPGERALAGQLEVSRGSLREALRVLEALGAIRTGTGSGPGSGTIITATPEQALSLALGLQLASSQLRPEHVSETRLLLERWAAEHSDPAAGEWAAAEALLERMDDPALGVEEFLSLDAEFHATLSRAAGNPFVSALMTALRAALAELTLARAQALPDWSATAARLRAEHRAVLALLREGRGQDAAAALERHIRGYLAETGG